MQLLIPNSVTFICLPPICEITGEFAGDTSQEHQLDSRRKRKKKLVSYISVNRQDYYLRILLWKTKGKNCKVRQMTDVNNIWRMLFPQEEIASGIQLTASSLNTHQVLGIVSSLKCTGMGTFPECTIIQQLLKSFIISQANITGIRQ